jgi:hypothetical protein
MGTSKQIHMPRVDEAGADATLIRAAQSTINVKSLPVSRFIMNFSFVVSSQYSIG